MQRADRSQSGVFAPPPLGHVKFQRIVARHLGVKNDVGAGAALAPVAFLVAVVEINLAPGGKPLIYLGSSVTEGGDGLAWVDLDGKKRGGKGWIGGTWTGAPFLARDDGPERVPGVILYVGAAWEADLRLTALTWSTA